jgi:hypothetical protein
VTYQYEFNFHCGFFINCTYDGENLVGHGLGALTASEENGQTRIEEAVTHKTGGSLCPETVHLDQLITPLEKAYLVTREEESLKMVCLKVSNENTGLYNSSGNGQTCESDNAERVGNYELALVLPSLGTGQMACGEVEHSGFLLSFGGGKECQTKDLERKGLYELGVIQ